MTLTIKELAKELHTSVATISRVVNNKGNVNEKTRQEILRKLEPYDYVPNQVARSLKGKATKMVGIIIPDLNERFFTRVIKGIDSILSKKGYSIILADTNEDHGKEARYIDLLLQQRVDAAIIATADPNGTEILQLIDHEIPVVFIDNQPNLQIQYDAVLTDNIYASKLAVNYFVGRGHKKIACITGTVSQASGRDRLLGYRLAMQEAELPISESLIAVGDFREKSGFTAMEAFIQNKAAEDFTAVYIVSERMTLGALKSLKAHDFHVPTDIEVIGFDFEYPSVLLDHNFVTIRQPEQQIGEATAELLLKRLEKSDKIVAGQHVLLTPYLEIS